MLDSPDDEVFMQVGPLSSGAFPMSNGLTRLQTRFLGHSDALETVLSTEGPVNAEEAMDLGLVTFAPDDLDWDDEIRLVVEERASYSPDALTGMEASLRFVGPETMETKIFGRLSAWQNWIFQRPNAVGGQGALSLYGRPERAVFDWRRT
jgi:benzoyl-CoA-dihydrodiol lyase